MALQFPSGGEKPSSFHYACVLRDMADAERILANQIFSTRNGIAPDGRYIYGKHGTVLQSLQIESNAMETTRPVWENEIPINYPLLRAYIAHSPINLPVASMSHPSPIRVEDGPAIYARKIDPNTLLPAPRPN